MSVYAISEWERESDGDSSLVIKAVILADGENEAIEKYNKFFTFEFNTLTHSIESLYETHDGFYLVE